MFRYPDDFPNASELRTGEYIVIWYRETDGERKELAEVRYHNRM